jgi:hypothetical protein
MRKSRFFQRDAYISVDFLQKSAEIVRMKEVEGEPDPCSLTIDLGDKGKKEILFEKPVIEESNAIRDELQSFAESIINDRPTEVSLEQGSKALEVALIILEKMRQSVILQSED